jgi:hypothetical protein
MKRHKFHTIHLLIVAINFCLLSSIQLTVARSFKNAGNSTRLQSKITSEVLVIMSNDVNVSKIYNSFHEFQRIFDVKFPSDKKLTFKNGEGEFILLYFPGFQIPPPTPKNNSFPTIIMNFMMKKRMQLEKQIF